MSWLCVQVSLSKIEHLGWQPASLLLEWMEDFWITVRWAPRGLRVNWTYEPWLAAADVILMVPAPTPVNSFSNKKRVDVGKKTNMSMLALTGNDISEEILKQLERNVVFLTQRVASRYTTSDQPLSETTRAEGRYFPDKWMFHLGLFNKRLQIHSHAAPCHLDVNPSSCFCTFPITVLWGHNMPVWCF